jgi:hypothetical protein
MPMLARWTCVASVKVTNNASTVKYFSLAERSCNATSPDLRDGSEQHVRTQSELQNAQFPPSAIEKSQRGIRRMVVRVVVRQLREKRSF